MAAIPVTCIFDVGRTNKKVLLFDHSFQCVYEESTTLQETTDEDGFPCEDVRELTQWLRDRYAALRADHHYDICRINFSGYGASFVLLDVKGLVIAPLYNYLKPYPQDLQEQFYFRYGGQQRLCRETASPALGSLNAGLQLYRLKYQQPELFSRTKVALHLPNYLSYVFSGNCVSEITSLGCHTHLWDFGRHGYHEWVQRENILEKLAPLQSCGSLSGVTADGKLIGVGLHDSSAALVPYLERLPGPFALISTGTWSICLNPFNDHPLTDAELQADCLCYLTFEGRQVKASRLFLGPMHDDLCRSLSTRYGTGHDHYQQVRFDAALFQMHSYDPSIDPDNYASAYHKGMSRLVDLQIRQLQLILHDTPAKQIYVDGGFAQNGVFMGILAARLPGFSIQAADMPQASALGAAMTIHKS
jgi:sugar (pentulose or hexulose) kinase